MPRGKDRSYAQKLEEWAEDAKRPLSQRVQDKLQGKIKGGQLIELTDEDEYILDKIWEDVEIPPTEKI